MRSILFILFIVLGSQLNAQIKIDPNKVKERAQKEIKKKEKVQKKQETNSLNNKQQVNRKRPGGTIQTAPSSSSKKEEGEVKPKKEGGQP